jgi:thioredoxin 1
MASENVLTFTDGAFDKEVLSSDVPVLVDFWAPWCGPCRAISPAVEALASEYAGKVKIGKMNVDDNQGTPARYEVRGIPTLLLFKGGRVVDQRVGLTSKPDLQKMLDGQLAATPVPVSTVATPKS